MSGFAGQLNSVVADAGKEASNKAKDTQSATQQGAGQIQKAVEKAVDTGADLLKKKGIEVAEQASKKLPGFGQ